MFQVRKKTVAFALALLSVVPVYAHTAADAEISELRRELHEQLKHIKDSYERRIAALESRLAHAEVSAAESKADIKSVAMKTEASAFTSAPTPAASGEGAFNPAVSLILAGNYTRLSRDPNHHQIGGFIPTQGEVAPPARSFSLGESELSISANIDPLWRGQFTASVPAEGGGMEIEEAYIQTLDLGHGATFKAGRFLSSIGYLNSRHAHVWDFADAPLAYKAFFGGQLKNDGVQLKWLAPTDLWLELGAELSRGGPFPSTDNSSNGSGLAALYAHVGGDAGLSSSWRAGLSYVGASPRDRAYEDSDSLGAAIENRYSGRSRMAVADFVWKWAPQGNARETNFKLQGEYFRRTESGTLASNSAAGACGGDCLGDYTARQWGAYLQGVYQFAPTWRLGLRYDRLGSGATSIGLVDSGVLSNADLPLLARNDPKRGSVMLDWSPSEFSRIRLQFARDESRFAQPDNQFWLQYIVSLGAHGAHKY